MNLNFIKFYSVMALPSLIMNMLGILYVFKFEYVTNIPELVKLLLIIGFIFNICIISITSLGYTPTKEIYLKYFGSTHINFVFSYIFLAFTILTLYKNCIVPSYISFVMFIFWEYHRRKHNKIIDDIHLQNIISLARQEKNEVELK